MANKDHLEILKQGVDVWNRWRKEHLEVNPDLYGLSYHGNDLSGADFSGANLIGADFSGADLTSTKFREANLTQAVFAQAKLILADFRAVDLTQADFSRADLKGADFGGATLSNARFRDADLTQADLRRATLVGTDLTNAILNKCHVHGISVWDVRLDNTQQENLVITDTGSTTITVDNLEVAQFIYLLLNNAKLRDIIDTIGKKAVLILGRFTPERKAVLDALKEALRRHGYVPILFDFDKPASRDITETVSTLAHLSRFVIADITDAKSIPQELTIIVPNLPSVPFQPLLLESQREYGMFEHFKRYPWVLPIYHYMDEESLLQSLKEKVIEPAEQKAQELEKL